MKKIIRIANIGDEEDFARFSERKTNLRAELEEKLEKEFIEKSAKLEAIIDLLSHEEEVEVEEPVVEEATEETVGE